MAKKVIVTDSEKSGNTASLLDDIINRDFEDLTNLSEVDTKVKLWYDWGIYAVNYIMSKNLRNGVPAGRISSIKGLSGVGKSLFLASLSKDKKIDKIIAMGSEGGGLSSELFEFTGADLSKIRLKSFTTFTNYKVNKATGAIEEVPDSKFPQKTDTDDYRYYEGITRFVKRFINSIEFNGIKANIVMMLDSLGNVKSVRELAGGSDMGARAKDINNFFGIFDTAFERTNIAFVFTNKVYTNLSNPYDPWVESGGLGASYNPSASIFLKDTSDTEDVADADMVKEKERRKSSLGYSLKLIKAVADKSRFGTEGRTVNVLLDLSYGPVRLSGLFQICKEFGILVKSGNSYTMPGIIDKSFYKKDFVDIILKDEEAYIDKIQARLEEAESIIMNKKKSLNASDLDDIQEEDTTIMDITNQMSKDLETD